MTINEVGTAVSCRPTFSFPGCDGYRVMASKNGFRHINQVAWFNYEIAAIPVPHINNAAILQSPYSYVTKIGSFIQGMVQSGTTCPSQDFRKF